MAVVEFTVEGPPVSCQSKNKVALGAWKARVRAAASAAWAEAPLRGALKCTIMNFQTDHEPVIGERNLVRPIRDAMLGVVYGDALQIRHAVHTQTTPGGKDGPQARWMSGRLLPSGTPFVFVRVEDAPAKVELPRGT
ncbi:MAG: hypothetical protein ACRC33_07075 [Gemmataceae bacterium]